MSVMMHAKKHRPFALAIFLCSCVLAGCGPSPSSQEEGTTLWVVTEQSCPDGMNLQAELIAQQMEGANENLTIRLDILPIEAEERETALRQLRTQIMAGKGPDVYLLPTGDALLIDYFSERKHRRSMEVTVTPLFSDVVQAMEGGLFADIQAYYDGDDALEKDALNGQIMDAGVLNGARYVLPLRYDTPVLLTAPEDWENHGLNANLLQSSVTTLVDAALAQEGAEMVAGLRLPDDLSLLPSLYDYENDTILLTAREIAEYLRTYQAWKAIDVKASNNFIQRWDDLEMSFMLKDPMNLSSEEWRKMYPFDGHTYIFNFISYYICVGTATASISWRAADFPLFTSALADTLNTVAIAKHEGWESAMYPLRSANGSVVASVTYYGSIGSSSQQPELAYAFLRQFLTEEFQWGTYRPRINKNVSLWEMPTEVQTCGDVENSWPVRIAGSVPCLWSSLKYQSLGIYSAYRKESKQISRQIQQIELTDEDVPALEWTFDEVRFPVVLSGENSMEHALSLLNEEDGTPTDVDIDALAQKVYQELWFHLMEG